MDTENPIDLIDLIDRHRQTNNYVVAPAYACYEELLVNGHTHVLIVGTREYMVNQ